MTLHPTVQFEGKVPKRGNSPDECEDQLALSPDRGVFAIADGASDAAYSKIWAQILVEAFCENDSAALDPSTFETWLEACRQKWKEWEKSLLLKDLPWFTREKLQQGSWSTFLGFRFHADSEWTDHVLWKAIAFGDSCLFVVQGDRLALAFPLENVGDFDTTPPLLSTLPQPVGEHLRIRSGSVSWGHKIYLMTDALAKWFLDFYDQGGQPWGKLDVIVNESHLNALVCGLRDAGHMRNDDVALIRISCEPPYPTNG